MDFLFGWFSFFDSLLNSDSASACSVFWQGCCWIQGFAGSYFFECSMESGGIRTFLRGFSGFCPNQARIRTFFEVFPAFCPNHLRIRTILKFHPDVCMNNPQILTLSYPITPSETKMNMSQPMPDEFRSAANLPPFFLLLPHKVSQYKKKMPLAGHPFEN
ncbi:hypothetical protein D3H55_15875 [Bacillus salacetis]|uniref:Uncharacterized protein n=1 Tax=Bacillus salacetis TaxID=2315464 RepID=A0A3A1QV24_9BACI|nr:hypothetical protein [Bacillus salacetis]RIW31084.1 hypothetical protein D3H55_15875 [Bacillus salacetis]